MELKFVTCVLDYTQFLVQADTAGEALRLAHEANTSPQALYDKDEMGPIDIHTDYEVEDVTWDFLANIFLHRNDLWFYTDRVIAFSGA